MVFKVPSNISHSMNPLKVLGWGQSLNWRCQFCWLWLFPIGTRTTMFVYFRKLIHLLFFFHVDLEKKATWLIIPGLRKLSERPLLFLETFANHHMKTYVCYLLKLRFSSQDTGRAFAMGYNPVWVLLQGDFTSQHTELSVCVLCPACTCSKCASLKLPGIFLEKQPRTEVISLN